ncbi:sulfatase [Membranicola marinus]|uniref:Sulfatase n=1 Tax=Membranihabitans marinus TaxID=1227546 RepID=A0A953HVZ0_9BACT|nr:sulfatase [Membranihabitans marinus]MBY5959166.1 sulfatase [Membranihabitans marinus]
MNIAPFILFLICLTLPSLLGQPKNDPKHPDRPNIVWITSEDNSKHYLSLFDKNGVATPNITALAKEGLRYIHAFSNAPVCSVARSTIITGCYAPRIGAQFHRKIRKVPMHEGLKMFPEYLREAGYYTSNNSKEDYNLEKSSDVWDDSSKRASWKNRRSDQPFFHMVNIGVTHESSLHFDADEMTTQGTHKAPREVYVQPNHPNTGLFRYTNATYRDRIQQMDQRFGDIIKALEKDGQMDNTIIFYFGDHGGVLPGSKGYLYETGLHVPLVMYVPPKYREILGVEAGTDVTGFVSFIDLAPTVLALAGIEVPEEMDGKPFLSSKVDRLEVNQRDETYSYADRFDEKYDMVRAVRKGKYKYIRSFQPFYVDGLMNNYRYKQLAYQEWDSLYRAGTLNDTQSRFFEMRPPEMLFDVEADPYETNNLADNPEYLDKLVELRNMLNDWLTGMPDLSFYPEYVLINEAFDNPAAYGQTQKKEINSYLRTGNLCLPGRANAQKELTLALRSADPWQRYWGLVAATSMDKKADLSESLIAQIMHSDPVPIIQVQAALYLALEKGEDPSSVMTQALYDAKYPAEGLHILNTIVLMRDWAAYIMPAGAPPVKFDIRLDKINAVIREESEVQRRLDYLGV